MQRAAKNEKVVSEELRGWNMKDVLVVDDERPFRESLAEGLSFYSRYFTVITAKNGKQAMNILRTVAIDVVVTDLKMPDMDGFELVAYVKKQLPWVTVIVMTAHGDTHVEARLRSMGAAQFLEKPLDLTDVANKILAA